MISVTDPPRDTTFSGGEVLACPMTRKNRRPKQYRCFLCSMLADLFSNEWMGLSGRRSCRPVEPGFKQQACQLHNCSVAGAMLLTPECQVYERQRIERSSRHWQQSTQETSPNHRRLAGLPTRFA